MPLDFNNLPPELQKLAKENFIKDSEAFNAFAMHCVNREGMVEFADVAARLYGAMIFGVIGNTDSPAQAQAMLDMFATMLVDSTRRHGFADAHAMIRHMVVEAPKPGDMPPPGKMN